MRDYEYTAVNVNTSSPEAENQSHPQPQSQPLSEVEDQPSPEAQSLLSPEAENLRPPEADNQPPPEAAILPSPKAQINKQDAAKRSRLPQGWRRTVLAGCLATMLVLIINFVFLLWTIAAFPQETSVATIYTGSCSKTKAILAWSHLGINILGTMLLGASNSCMQVLLSPNRAEIDAAHRRDVWLDIGTQSFKNMFWIGRKRIPLWALIGLSSVPLHLLYNSVIVGSTTTNKFNAYTVTNSFFDVTLWNETQPEGTMKGCYGGGMLWDIRRDIVKTPYVRLQPQDCVNTYFPRQNSYGNVLLVTNEKVNESLVQLEPGMHQLCGEPLLPGILCNSTTKIVNRWEIKGHRNLNIAPNSSEQLPFCWPTPTGEPNHEFLIDHCLAQPTENTCRVFVSKSLLAVVIACNGIKFCCLLITFLFLGRDPIITIGDAMDSFLREVDNTTANFGPMCVRTIEKQAQGFVQPEEAGDHLWKRKRRSGMSAVSGHRWVLCNMLFIIALITTFVLLYQTIKSAEAGGEDVSLERLFAIGLGKTMSGADTDTSPAKIPANLISSAMEANTPQLIVSILYIAYNDLFTRMAIAREWSSFYRTDGSKQPLRVSRPRGLQRSTSFLQLPFWWSVPIMAMNTCLHWAISQSLFAVIEGVADYTNRLSVTTEDLSLSVTTQTVACSPVGIIMSAIVGGVMVMVLWIAPKFVVLSDGMPVVRTNSAAISAACRRRTGDDDVAVKLVSWGVWSDEGGVEHVGFSSRETRPLQDGVGYSD